MGLLNMIWALLIAAGLWVVFLIFMGWISRIAVKMFCIGYGC